MTCDTRFGPCAARRRSRWSRLRRWRSASRSTRLPSRCSTRSRSGRCRCATRRASCASTRRRRRPSSQPLLVSRLPVVLRSAAVVRRARRLHPAARSRWLSSARGRAAGGPRLRRVGEPFPDARPRAVARPLVHGGRGAEPRGRPRSRHQPCDVAAALRERHRRRRQDGGRERAAVLDRRCWSADGSWAPSRCRPISGCRCRRSQSSREMTR